jgi:hypothetical protein
MAASHMSQILRALGSFLARTLDLVEQLGHTARAHRLQCLTAFLLIALIIFALLNTTSQI